MSNPSLTAGKYILISTLNKTLALYQGNRLVNTYNIEVGKQVAPIGQYKIVNKIINPENAWGTRWLGLSATKKHYGIHGTNAQSSIGKAVTNGCIIMCNREIEQLFSLVTISTPVLIVANTEKPKAIAIEDIQHIDNDHQAIESTNDAYIEDLLEQPIEAVSETPAEQFNEEEPQKPATPLGVYYQVIPGDTLWTIARRFGLPVQLLVASNPLENPNKIYPGQKIFIPKRRIGF